MLLIGILSPGVAAGGDLLRMSARIFLEKSLEHLGWIFVLPIRAPINRRDHMFTPTASDMVVLGDDP
jgi:hypothetical protein